MHRVSRLIARVRGWGRALFLRRAMDRELDDELRFHLEREAAEQLTRGLTPDEARAAARRTLGGVDRIAEACRDARGAASLDAWRRDLRHGVRLLRRTPGFTLVAIVSLGLGIGANSAVFSLLDAAVLRPVPYADGDRLMTLLLRARRPGPGGNPWSYPKFEELVSRVGTFETLAGYAGTDVNVARAAGGSGGEPQRIRGELVSAAYARTLRLSPILGRDFRPDEDRAPGALVALVSEDLWRRQLGGGRDVFDRPIVVNARSVRVIGILPSGFRGESGRAELWMPLATAPLVTGRAGALVERGAHWFDVIGRLRPEITPAQADADVRRVVSGMDHGTAAAATATLGGGAVPLAETKVDPLVRRALFALLAAVALVLLIACLNLGSLLLARAMARQREIAVRLALGASRAALVRQFLTESLLVAALGGVAGLVMARGLLDLVRAAQPPPTWDGAQFLRGLDFGLAQIDAVVVTFTAIVTLLTVIVFGVGPAWHAARGDVQQGLKADPRWGGGPGWSRGARPEGEGWWRQAAWALGGWHLQPRSLLVVAQLACTLVLVVAAGLMVRSVAELVQAPVGIDPRDTLTFRLDLPRRASAPASAGVPASSGMTARSFAGASAGVSAGASAGLSGGAGARVSPQRVGSAALASAMSTPTSTSPPTPPPTSTRTPTATRMPTPPPARMAAVRGDGAGVDASVLTFETLTERLAALPGVASVALTDTLPLTRPRETTAGQIDGVTEWPDLPVVTVSPAYFNTLGVPLRQGRVFEAGDRLGSRRVAVVSEAAARRYWPDGDPIGHRVTLRLVGWNAPEQAAEIVGVVGDVKYGRPDERPRPMLYLSVGQRPASSLYVAMRARTDPAALTAPVRREVAGLDASLPVYDVQTMAQRVAAVSARPRFQSVLLALFAGLALLLAAIGVSGVMAYMVTMRTRELGVRLALGADRADISRLVVRHAAGLAAFALVLGLPLAFASTRILQGLLFGVTPTDPATFAIAALVLVGVALVACWRPARRAARIDPLAALRHD